MGPIKEGSTYCPQSEPVKRKVYAGSATYGRIQKTLGEHVMLRNSDGDTATDDTGEPADIFSSSPQHSSSRLSWRTTVVHDSIITHRSFYSRERGFRSSVSVASFISEFNFANLIRTPGMRDPRLKRGLQWQQESGVRRNSK